MLICFVMLAFTWSLRILRLYKGILWQTCWSTLAIFNEANQILSLCALIWVEEDLDVFGIQSQGEILVLVDQGCQGTDTNRVVCMICGSNDFSGLLWEVVREVAWRFETRDACQTWQARLEWQGLVHRIWDLDPAFLAKHDLGRVGQNDWILPKRHWVISFVLR